MPKGHNSGTRGGKIGEKNMVLYVSDLRDLFRSMLPDDLRNKAGIWAVWLGLLSWWGGYLTTREIGEGEGVGIDIWEERTGQKTPAVFRLPFLTIRGKFGRKGMGWNWGVLRVWEGKGVFLFFIYDIIILLLLWYYYCYYHVFFKLCSFYLRGLPWTSGVLLPP